MNKRQTEYIALYLFVFGAILLFGVLVRKFVLVKGYDEFSAAVGFFATVVVLSALYISLQMTLNELLLPRMEKFLMRFPAFQKLEKVAVATDVPTIVAEPIEEIAVPDTNPQPSEYEVLRANAIAEQERASQAKMDRVLDYTKQTMVAYMSEEELERLCGYITEYSLGDTLREVSPVKVDSTLKSIDLMHFGWNIGKAFGKKRIYTATFIKNVFAHSLRDLEISTIERKMSHTESGCRIKLNGNIKLNIYLLKFYVIRKKLYLYTKFSFIMGFRLYSIRTDYHNLQLVDVGHNDDNSNYTTLLIGNNGTGKSTILSTIARHFNEVFKYRYAQETLFPDRFKYKTVPSKVIATTHSISDKFPNDNTYSNRSDFTTIDFDAHKYLYLGARNRFNGFSSKALINKSMDIVLEQYLKSEVSTIYKHIFDYLGFEPILKIEYKINNRIRNVSDIKSEIQNRILPKSNKYINLDVIEYIENNIERIIEFLVSHESNRDSIVINFSSKNIDRISKNGSIYSEQYETYNIINILRKIEIITGYDIVVYKKNGNKFNLTNASSGELCILSTFLGLIPMLKDNCLVLIDEPEISLHPLWQSKYIELVSKIFSYFKGCHIIIATHSHFLVTDLIPKKSSIVVLKNDGKTITGDLLLEPTYGWSAEDILLDVFKTPSTRNYYLSQRISRMLELIADKQNETEEYSQLKKQVIPFYEVLKDTDPLKDIIALLKEK